MSNRRHMLKLCRLAGSQAYKAGKDRSEGWNVHPNAETWREAWLAGFDAAREAAARTAGGDA